MFKARYKEISFCSDTLLTELDELRFMLLLHEASVRATSVGQYEWDYKNNRLRSCSKEYAALFGHRHVNIAGRQSSWEKFLDQIHPDDRDSYLKTCDQRLTRRSVTSEYRILLPNGTTRHVQETGIYNQPSPVVARGNFGIIRDITLQKEVEKSLDNEDRSIAEVAGFKDLGGFLYDEVHSKFLYADESLANIYGVEQDCLLDNVRSRKEDFEFVYKDDRELVQQVYEDFEIGDIWEVEYRMVQPDGKILWVREMGKSFLVQNGVEEQSIGVILDISDRKKADIELMKIRDTLEQQVAERTVELDRTVNLLTSEVEEKKKIAAKLRYLANHDPLTGLPGIRLCMDRLSRALASAERNRDTCAIMFLDLDHFKPINDKHGHWYGDKTLRIVADRFQGVVRKVDTVARIGGDEFMVILSGIRNNEIVEQIAAKLIEETTKAITIGKHDFTLGLSIGIALYPAHGLEADDLTQAADQAMYQAKKDGRNCFRFSKN